MTDDSRRLRSSARPSSTRHPPVRRWRTSASESSAPGVLRRRDLIARLGAIDLGDVDAAAVSRLREAAESRAERGGGRRPIPRALAERVAAATRGGRFASSARRRLQHRARLSAGGATERADGPVGLAYVDAHDDFATPQESQTGSVSGMSLALASGRGDTPLARCSAGDAPLVGSGRVGASSVVANAAAGVGPRRRSRRRRSSIFRSRQFTTHTASELAAAALARVLSPRCARLLDPSRRGRARRRRHVCRRFTERRAG